MKATESLFDARPSTVVFDGEFWLCWLRDDSCVFSAGDGTGAVIVQNAAGEARRIEKGEEIPVPL